MHRLDRPFAEVREEVLKKVKPTQEDDRKIREAISSLMEEIERRRVQLSPPWEVKVELVGSIAKGTHLKRPDIDIFLLFPREAGMDALNTWGLKLCQMVLPEGKKLYTQHPYIRGRFGGFEVDLVPCLEMKEGEDIGSMVDRTPLHTRFVMKHLDRKGRDEVRLFKAFLKGIRAYGAEEAVKGVSGYLAELFIIKFGTFERTLEEVSRIMPHSKLTIEVSGSVNPLKRRYSESDPLIFVDPVDPTRNVASALSYENLLYIKKAARAYIQTPSLTFFFPRGLCEVSEGHKWVYGRIQRVMDRGGGLLLIGMELPRVQPDIYVSQARRFLRKALEAFEREGFRRVKGHFYIYSPDHVDSFPAPRIKEHIAAEEGEIIFLFHFPEYVKGERRLHVGPPVGVEDRAEDFRKKWEGHEEAMSRIFVREGRLVLYVRRRIREPQQLIPEILKGLPSHLKKVAGSRITIASNRGVNFEKYWEALYLFYSGKELWEL